MKKLKAVLTVLPFTLALFLGGCADMLMEQPNVPELAEGEGLLVISLVGANVGAGSALTMLPPDPQFTRYELEYDDGSNSGTVTFYNSSFQLVLGGGTYNLNVKGYLGDKVVATDSKSGLIISAGDTTPISFTLKPDMSSGPGVLDFSLSWDGLSRMPYQAELLIEQYADGAGAPINPPEPIAHSLIPPEFSQGSAPGTIILLQRDTAFVNMTGSLTLPAGEYHVTMTVTMDQGGNPVGRMDFAHIYSNLTTPAAFYYGGGDLLVSNTSPDLGVSFITSFTFTETPTATTVIGSEPGSDGTRMIMIMVPSTAELDKLTPVVTTAPGSKITSPVPVAVLASENPDAAYIKGEIDFTNPTIWTAQAKNGAVQKYTVVVSKVPTVPAEKRITYFFFKEYPKNPAIIDQVERTISVVLPSGAKAATSNDYTLMPVVSFIGEHISYDNGSETPIDGDGDDIPMPFDNSPILRVYENGTDPAPKSYTVKVLETESGDKEIISFSFEGYPDVVAVNTNPTTADNFVGKSPDAGYYPIQLTLPYGVSLKRLTPVINYVGESIEPESGVIQNFNVPVFYSVTASDNTTIDYKVTVKNKTADNNTGIFDFRVTYPPAAKVVIGQKPRQDGKIPIIIQIPYYPPANNIETKMIAAITLSSPDSTIVPPSGLIPFDNKGNPKEAVYTVTAQGGATQDYVAVVSMSPQYYYVDGTDGDDNRPDIYNGGSKDYPFKTLAHAVQEAAKDGIEKVFIIGDLTADAGGDIPPSADSAFTINGTDGKTITITSTTGSTLRGTSGKRVLTVKGGADLVFENINITGGNAANTNTDAGKGGGIYITGDHNKVKFSGGSITGNTAYSGGGVYIEDNNDDGDPTIGSEFTFMGDGTISGNTATGAAAGATADGAGMGGGGGVYVKGNALFWLAGGTVSGNTTKGAGGGVLVNGNVVGSVEDGFLMSGGRIVNNTTTSTTYPHGGGGVYVAHGAFEMLDGEVTGNTAKRQGGGVFVHWGDARFTASGNSTITGNEGVGSSKAICNRGTTEMMGSARADKVYVWNYDDDPPPPYNPNNNQSFKLAQNAQITGIVLAYSAENANVIEIDDPLTGTNTICTIDLESHLNSGGNFAGQLEPDWIGKNIIKGVDTTLTSVLDRLPLNSFTGQPSVYNMGTNYKIVVSGGYGKFEKK
jgi:hypothetical protein